jgi:enoyl-[acyl-carrier protein] reductase I
MLEGKKALVVGIANENSIAYGCAKAFRDLKADLAITYLNEEARRFVEPFAQELAPIFLPLDVSVPGQLEHVFDAIASQVGPARHPGPLDRVRAEGRPARRPAQLLGERLRRRDRCVVPFVRAHAKLAVPLMRDGGTMFAMTYHGANPVVPTYSVMGPVKAALEVCCRYLAYELGPKGIRAHAISPGPLKTRAASGIKDFELLLNEAEHRAPLGELVDIMDVGYSGGFLSTPYARRMSGATLYVDGGVNIMA